MKLNQRFQIFWLLTIVLFIFGNDATPLLALQDVEIVAAASAEEIFVGESIDYQIELRNAKSPSVPNLSAVKERFDVVEMGNQSRNQSQMTFSNGRVTRNDTFSHIYQFRLTPKESGVLTIPAVTAKMDGQEYKSNELQLRVMQAEKQDYVLVEINSDQTNVYPTQPFEISLRILVQPIPGKGDRIDPLRPLRNSPPHIDINWVDAPAGLTSTDKVQWLQPFLSQDGVGFSLNDVSARTGSIFGGTQAATFGLSKGREVHQGIDGRSIDYYKYELTRKFTAGKAGSYSFGPAIVKGAFVTGIEGNDLSTKKIIASSPQRVIEVRDVPSPRPATYCGGIGEYQWRAAVSPAKLRVGDPLTLTLEAERGEKSGSFDLIFAPDLSAVDQFLDGFDLIDKNPTGRVEATVKKFVFAMRPKRANVNIPAFTISSFDPRTEKFIDVVTSPIALEVTEASSLTSGELIGTNPSIASKEIKTRSEGIFQNITDPSAVKNESVNLGGWGQFAAVVWAAVGTIVAWVTFYRRKSLDVVKLRRQQAKRNANRRLTIARESMELGDSKEALRQLRGAVLGLAADTRDRLEESLTTSDVDEILSKASVPSEDRAEVSRLLELIEAAEYGAHQTTDITQAITKASTLVARIAPVLEKGK